MLDVEIGIDQGLDLAAFRRALECGGDSVKKAAVGQVKVPHEVADGRTLASAASNPARGSAEDPLPSLLLVLSRVSHRLTQEIIRIIPSAGFAWIARRAKKPLTSLKRKAIRVPLPRAGKQRVPSKTAVGDRALVKDRKRPRGRIPIKFHKSTTRSLTGCVHP